MKLLTVGGVVQFIYDDNGTFTIVGFDADVVEIVDNDGAALFMSKRNLLSQYDEGLVIDVTPKEE